MSKSIHERVRATLAKAALAEKRAEAKAQAVADAPMHRRMNAQARRDIAAELRIDGLIDGSIEPQTVEELRIAEGDTYDDGEDCDFAEGCDVDAVDGECMRCGKVRS